MLLPCLKKAVTHFRAGRFNNKTGGNLDCPRCNFQVGNMQDGWLRISSLLNLLLPQRPHCFFHYSPLTVVLFYGAVESCLEILTHIFLAGSIKIFDNVFFTES